MSTYPVLTGEIAKRGIKKLEIAQSIGISYSALKNKLKGKTPFTWPEACALQSNFFPDIDKDELFMLEFSPIPRDPAA